MRIWGFILGGWVACVGLAAAQDSPQLEVVFEETETIPGQALTLRFTVLVPTFMPNPPVWPDMESPNLMVRLPEKASSPTSKTVNGETWSGISRRYQITPLVPGRFTIAAGAVQVSYRAASGDEVLQATLPVPEISVVGVVPEGAEDLDPFVAAQELSLSQIIEGETEGMAAGGSVTRILTADISGAPSLFVPPLTPQDVPVGLRAYPESPFSEDREDRGVISGSRAEKTVYVAEGGVDGVLPEVRLKWYNLQTKTVEEAVLPAVPVRADPPVGAGSWPEENASTGLDQRQLSIVALVLLFVGVALVFWGRLRALSLSFQDRWMASEAYAWRDLKTYVRARDLGATRQAFAQWRTRAEGNAPEQEGAVERAFFALGSGLFGRRMAPNQEAEWKALDAGLRDLRRALRRQRQRKNPALAPLNPAQTAGE